MGILAAIIGFFSGPVARELAAAFRAKQDAKTDAERAEADERIAVLQARRDVLLAEAGGGGLASWIRPLFALPFVIYIWKLVIWDKVLAFGVTDPLSPQLSDIMMLVIGAYFVGRTAEKVTRIITSR
jgi:hypothetical protein